MKVMFTQILKKVICLTQELVNDNDDEEEEEEEDVAADTPTTKRMRARRVEVDSLNIFILKNLKTT